jgi:hypothetical protein
VSFADRHGLSLGALFVNAVDRWAGQESIPRERRSAISADGPTLFDFARPAELRVEAAAREFGPAGRRQASIDEGVDATGADDITAELARLFDARPAGSDAPNSAVDQPITTARPAGRAEGS